MQQTTSERSVPPIKSLENIGLCTMRLGTRPGVLYYLHGAYIYALHLRGAMINSTMFVRRTTRKGYYQAHARMTYSGASIASSNYYETDRKSNTRGRGDGRGINQRKPAKGVTAQV